MTIETILESLRAHDLLETAKVIAARHRLTMRDMFGRSRMRPAPEARAEFCAYLYCSLRWSYPRIGALMGQDHTTVIAAVRGHELRTCEPVARTRVA